MKNLTFGAIWLVYSLVVSPVFSAPTVGYGSTTTALSATDQSVFYMGFEVGVKAALKAKMPAGWLLTVNSQESGDLSPNAVAKKLAESGVSLLVGFPTSHEALMMGEIAKRDQILAISACAGHQGMAEKGDTVFSMGESMETMAKFFLSFLSKKFPKGANGLMVVNPNTPFSTNKQAALYKIQADEPKYKSLVLERLPLESPKDRIEPAARDRLAKQDYDFLVIAMYPDEAGPLLEVMDGLAKQVPVLSSTWTTAEVEMLRKVLSRYRAPFYGTSITSSKLPATKKFEKFIHSTLGRAPTSEVAYAHDLGVVTATILNRAGADRSRAGILKAFRSNLCFENTSVGTMCFPPKGGHALRDLYVVRYHKEKGFITPDNE